MLLCTISNSYWPGGSPFLDRVGLNHLGVITNNYMYDLFRLLQSNGTGWSTTSDVVNVVNRHHVDWYTNTVSGNFIFGISVDSCYILFSFFLFLFQVIVQRNQRVLSSSPASSGPSLIDNRHGSRSSSGSYSQSPGLLQWRVCRSASGSVQPPPVWATARLVIGLPGRAPVMSAICDTLHWLSYPQRVTFKVCLTTYKCLSGLAPSYLTRFCTPLSAVAGRTHLRSADQHKLFVHRTSTSMFGLRAFSSYGLLSWNVFPHSFVTQPSPSTFSDNPWKLIFSTTILIDCVSLLFCTCIVFF